MSFLSKCNSVSDVSTSGLACSDNLHYLTSPNAKVSRNSIFDLNLWKLVLSDAVFLEKLLLLLTIEDHMLWYEIMLSDVDH